MFKNIRDYYTCESFRTRKNGRAGQRLDYRTAWSMTYSVQASLVSAVCYFFVFLAFNDSKEILSLKTLHLSTFAEVVA